MPNRLTHTDQPLTTYHFDLGASTQNIPDITGFVNTLPFPDSYIDGTITMYFSGWFTADGTDGIWGEEISNSPYIDESGTTVTLYARFNDQERKDGSALFPFTANDTEWSAFKISGEEGQIVCIKIPAKKGFAVVYINGIFMWYLIDIPFATENYVYANLEVYSYVEISDI